jgi:hypothetical protein
VGRVPRECALEKVANAPARESANHAQDAGAANQNTRRPLLLARVFSLARILELSPPSRSGYYLATLIATAPLLELPRA